MQNEINASARKVEQLGEKYREAREELGYTVEEVSEQTKIRAYIISAIEDGDLKVVPEVYLKSFLRTYGQFLNFPEYEINDIIDEFEKFLYPDAKSRKARKQKSKYTTASETQPHTFKKENLQKFYRKNLINTFLYIIIGGVALAIVYFTLFYNTSGDSGQNAINKILFNEPDTAVVGSGKNLLSLTDEPDSLILQATAIDSAWIRIEIDNRASEQVIMVPGMEQRWSASDHFVVSVSNAGAVKFTRDGTPLGLFGKRGSLVRDVRITRNEVYNSSSPWSKNKSDDNSGESKKRISRSKNDEKKSEKPMPFLLEPSKIKKPKSLRESEESGEENKPD